MTRRPACLQGASSRFLDPHGIARDLHKLCKQAACSKFESWRGLTRTLWGAYGVVGFSGVKDARKSVFIADASASAGFWRPIQAEEPKRKAERQHLESISIADRKHSVNKGTAHGAPNGQTLDKDWTNTGEEKESIVTAQTILRLLEVKARPGLRPGGLI